MDFFLRARRGTKSALELANGASHLVDHRGSDAWGQRVDSLLARRGLPGVVSLRFGLSKKLINVGVRDERSTNVGHLTAHVQVFDDHSRSTNQRDQASLWGCVVVFAIDFIAPSVHVRDQTNSSNAQFLTRHGPRSADTP